MKFDTRKAADSDFKPGSSTGITAENYVDRARAFIRGNGGEGFVIRSLDGPNGSAAKQVPPTEAQWIAWMRWFDAKKITVMFAKSNGLTTVPTEWPESFDAMADYSDRLARLLPLKVIPADHDRAAILERETERLARRGIYLSRRRNFVPPPEPELDPYRYRDAPCAPLGSYVHKEPDEAA